MKKFLATVIFMLSLINVACAEEHVIEYEPARNLSTSVDEFSWKYFATLNRKENIFYSPYGINAALSILANGASGDTLKEILFALSADNVEALNNEHKRFSNHVEKTYGDENILMESNLLLIDKKVIGNGLNEDFKGVVNDVYKSDVRQADFTGDLDGEKQKISQWVSDKTVGFIPNYKSVATDDTLTDLLNVVYFKGKWAMPFKAQDSHKENFKNLDGETPTVDMMNKVFKDEISYRESDKFKGIKLPYSEGVAMYLILPVDDDALNIAELWNEESFSYRAGFIKALSFSDEFKGKVVVRLPKFELDIENSLVDNFKAMGIKKSFTDAAEFFNIINGAPLKIGKTNHRAKLKVDEQGTEASAVTEIEMLVGAAPPSGSEPKTVYFIADRPFLFLIRDTESGVTLFTGVVNNL